MRDGTGVDAGEARVAHGQILQAHVLDAAVVKLTAVAVVAAAAGRVSKKEVVLTDAHNKGADDANLANILNGKT